MPAQAQVGRALHGLVGLLHELCRDEGLTEERLAARPAVLHVCDNEHMRPDVAMQCIG